jgi:hypothetical protein
MNRHQEEPMIEVQVYDPAMCCSTGVCGPAVDPRLVQFSADLAWLAEQGVTVTRFNLAQQPAAFVADADVARALEAQGADSLPLVKVSGVVKAQGTYPGRAELAAWAGVALTVSNSPIGPAPASNCCAPSAKSTRCC